MGDCIHRDRQAESKFIMPRHGITKIMDCDTRPLCAELLILKVVLCRPKMLCTVMLKQHQIRNEFLVAYLEVALIVVLHVARLPVDVADVEPAVRAKQQQIAHARSAGWHIKRFDAPILSYCKVFRDLETHTYTVIITLRRPCSRDLWLTWS